MSKRLVVVGRFGPVVHPPHHCTNECPKRTGEIRLDNSIIRTGRRAVEKGA